MPASRFDLPCLRAQGTHPLERETAPAVLRLHRVRHRIQRIALFRTRAGRADGSLS
jgi:hypothetical protein